MKTKTVPAETILNSKGLRLDAEHYVDPTRSTDEAIAKTEKALETLRKRLTTLKERRAALSVGSVTVLSLWKHHNGNKYIVLASANEYSQKPEYPIVIFYMGENGRVWSRPLEDWHRSMTLLDEKPSKELLSLVLDWANLRAREAAKLFHPIFTQQIE